MPTKTLSLNKYMSIEKSKNSFFIFFRFIYYVYNILPPCMPACQRRAPDLITGGCEPPCGCWELNSEPLEEQPAFLATEPSLQPPKSKTLM